MAGEGGDLDIEKVAVVRPTWEMHKKGEIMLEKDFYTKYYNFSMPTLRNAYGNAIIGRIKYHHKMGAVRAKEQRIMEDLSKEKAKTRGRSWSQESQTSKDGSTVWSDTSSHQSMFKASQVKGRNKSRIAKAVVKEDPQVTDICERIGRLVETRMVQEACVPQNVAGSKYLFFGGGATYSQQFLHHSKEDPWKFPQV